MKNTEGGKIRNSENRTGAAWLFYLICNFLVANDVQHLLMFTCYLFILFGEVSAKVVFPSFTWVACFHTVEF